MNFTSFGATASQSSSLLAPSSGKLPCKHWAKYSCNFGAACNFAHEGPGGHEQRSIFGIAPVLDITAGVAADGAPICKHFLAGKCNYENCKFSHAASAPGAGVSPYGVYKGPGSLICK